ncbi:MAG: hypothetical protein MZW92_24795 [Comamonadaceae bacterium]|nr:hypothetical protein [Comamonadaceae bacterium]
MVYAVMLELGLNGTELRQVPAGGVLRDRPGHGGRPGLIFAPFTLRYGAVRRRRAAVAMVVLPWLTPRFFRAFGGRPSELEAKYLLLVLFGLGGARDMGGQRSRAARLPDRHGAGRHRGQGSRADPPAAHADLRPADAVLLHPGRARSCRCQRLVAAPAAVLGLLLAKLVDQDHRRLAGRAPVPLPAHRGGVHDAAHVDRADLRQHLRAASASRTASSIRRSTPS